MLKIDLTKGEGFTLATLTGKIDESSDFAKGFGNVDGPLRVNTKGVIRINSVGTKNWIRFFQSVTASGVPLVFEECSPAIVEQINMVGPFLCGGTVESIYLPFFCPACGAECQVPMAVDELRTAESVSPPACPKCGTETEFDEIPDEYLAFIGRM